MVTIPRSRKNDNCIDFLKGGENNGHLSDQNLRKAVDKLVSSEYSGSEDRTYTAQLDSAKSAVSAKR